MHFRLTGLDRTEFASLFGLDDAELARRGARRCVVDAKPGYPDRIELRDLEPGEAALLVNYVHQPGDSPFRSRHAIYVGERSRERYDAVDRLTAAGRTARRLHEGMLEWRLAGLPVDDGVA